MRKRLMIKMPRHSLSCLTLVLTLSTLLTVQAQACPFCSAVSQTFAEEMESMDVVILARMTEPPTKEEREHPTGQDLPRCKFTVVKVIKGDKWAPRDSEVSSLFFGEVDEQSIYLLMASDPPNLLWGSPLPLTDRAREYVEDVVVLPQDDERMKFFLGYLEDDDEMLARDAYDEFARASYETVKGLKPLMNRQQLLDWIRDTDIPIGRRKLYMTMLGICGNTEDALVLKEMIESSERTQKGGLDALVAAYLMLEGETGLDVIDRALLANEESEYADTYAAIMALRFHGNEADRIPRARLLKSMYYILDRPDLADLVIPDLARWEDWSAAPRLMDLFKNADEEAAWVRVPVINYLKASTLPDKDQRIAELEKIDPEAVKRANAFFAFSGLISQGAQRGTAGAPDADDPDADDPDADDPDADDPDADDPDADNGAGIAGDATGQEFPSDSVATTSGDSSVSEPVAVAARNEAVGEETNPKAAATESLATTAADRGAMSVTLPTATAVGPRQDSFLTGGVLIAMVVLVLVALLFSALVLKGRRV